MSTSTSISQPPLLEPFLSLPPELHLLIAKSLEYPDLLSLKISHPRIRTILSLSRQPTVHQRISWVMTRASRGLPIPANTGLTFRSDEAFVSNPEVRRILRERRQHKECVDALESDSESESGSESGSEIHDSDFDSDSDSASSRPATPAPWVRIRSHERVSIHPKRRKNTCLVTGGTTSCPKVETALAQTQTRRRRQRRQRHLREDETESTFAIITYAVLDCVHWTLGPAIEGITDAVSAAIQQIRGRFSLPVSSWKFRAVHGTVLDSVHWTLGPAIEGITDAVSAVTIPQIRRRVSLPVSSWKFWAVHGMGYFLLLFAAQRFQILNIPIPSTVRPADNDNTGIGLVWDCGVWGTGIAGIFLWLLCFLLAEFERS
ncbi:hypothetical protein LTR20_009036 [Exophiala xenobiotica]|nr:hypothetical protein LTR93_004551 [Exophiala xenobiotica]KAK5367861.1 hypothetical protein LTS13_007791 [Exophiala xenobiotica]KAK5397655.1 hypothetical protein LTR79_005170 [Exophiala xenobiotica]KAK5415821.1 hypothetical protein LTR06_003873 [Exophiala xenobiotica]KAK5421247.1 hypothetical protein LTR90_002734 [Exophiala xenobiotica]